MTKYFRNAFATGGDRDPVPDLAAGTLVNYEKGYTPEYELDPDVDPSGNYVGRRRMNQLFNDITGNLKFWQENGAPEFVANDGLGNVYSYPITTVVRHNGVYYQAKVDGTTTMPPSAEWRVFAFDTDASPGSVVVRGEAGSADEGTAKFSAPTDPEHPLRQSDSDTEATADKLVLRDAHGTAKFSPPTDPAHPVRKQEFDEVVVVLAQPSMTGSATLNGATNNTVQLTGIVTTLGLEVGDVIRIQYSGYDKLHTVESITNNNSIIVNYEHAGNRGNGSLKLEDETASVTITRISKWFNAPIGLGQAWVDVKSSRVNNTAYTNQNPRGVQLSLASQGARYHISPDGDDWLTVANTDNNFYAVNNVVIPSGWSYRSSGFLVWLELR